MNNQPVYRKNQIQTLILLLKVLELKSHEDNFFELVLFLARYSFLFENPQDSVNSCTSEVPQIYTEQAFSDWSVKYIDPDGCSVKGAFRAAFHVGLSCLTVAGGVGLMAASGVGEVASAGAATPLAVAGATGGFAVFVSGMTAFACSAAELTTEIADCFTDNAPNAEVFPSGIGGCVGSGIDMANGFDAQKEGKKGPNQVKGEAIETLVTSAISTCAYGKSVADLAGNGMPTAKEAAGILYNEASHQYDMYSSANAIGDLTKDQ